MNKLYLILYLCIIQLWGCQTFSPRNLPLERRYSHESLPVIIKHNNVANNSYIFTLVVYPILPLEMREYRVFHTSLYLLGTYDSSMRSTATISILILKTMRDTRTDNSPRVFFIPSATLMLWQFLLLQVSPPGTSCLKIAFISVYNQPR